MKNRFVEALFRQKKVSQSCC